MRHTQILHQVPFINGTRIVSGGRRAARFAHARTGLATTSAVCALMATGLLALSSAPAFAEGGCGGGCGHGGGDEIINPGQEGEEGDGGGAGIAGGKGGDTSNIWGGSTGGSGGAQGNNGIGDDGGTGGSSSSLDSDGAGGGGGAHGFVWNAIIYDTYKGGDGGLGGTGFNGGGGGAGGWGAVVYTPGAYDSGELDVTITGGKGGDGGQGVKGDGGFGGSGGVGLATSGSLIQITLSASSTVTGGKGGKGGSVVNSIFGGRGGDGGHGVVLDGGTLINLGTIKGGDGGDGGYITSNAWTPGGVGGYGIYSTTSGIVIVNNGTISGGQGGYGNGAQINAIILDGGNSRLELWSKSNITGNVIATKGTGDTLALGGDDDGTFDMSQIGGAAKYQGIENFDKSGSSTWTTRNNVNFTGSASVSEGTLVVHGTIHAASVTIANGATVSGSGTLSGYTSVASGGTLAAGVANKTLTVDGNLNLASGAKLAVTAPGSSIATSGTATLRNGALVHIDGGAVTLGATHTILTANGGVTGTFGMARDFAFVDALLDHQANAVTLTVDRNDASFASVGASANHAAVSPVIEALGLGHDLHDAMLMLSDQEARDAFDQLSGEAVQASASMALIEDSDFVRDVVTNRIRDAFDGTASMSVMGFGPDEAQGDAFADPYRYAAWGTAFGGFGENEGDGNAAGLDRSSFGFLAGGDALVAETWRFGLFAGYSRSSFDADERASSGSSSNIHVGAYGGTEFGALALRFGAAYSWHQVETERTVAVGGFADRLTAEYDASTAQLFGEAGYKIDAGRATFEPFAGLAYVHLDTDGFTETGGPAALSGGGSSNGVTFTTLGLRASTGFAIAGMPARARGAVAWRHAFGDVTPLSTHAFAGSSAFIVAGTPIARDALVLEAGLDLDLSARAMLGVSYNGQIGGGAHDHAFSGNLKVRF